MQQGSSFKGRVTGDKTTYAAAISGCAGVFRGKAMLFRRVRNFVGGYAATLLGKVCFSGLRSICLCGLPPMIAGKPGLLVSQLAKQASPHNMAASRIAIKLAFLPDHFAVGF